MITLYKPDDEAEAIAIKALLFENNIESTVQSYHDTAYGGLYQNQYGWGIIKVSEDDLSRAQEIVSNWKANAPETLDFKSIPAVHEPKNDNIDQSITISAFLKITQPFILAVSLLINFYFLGSWLFYSFEDNPTHKQYDSNGTLVSKTEWGNNHNSPYKYTVYSSLGEKLVEFYDQFDIGRSDFAVEFKPKSKITNFDSNTNGIFELSKEMFNSGAINESKDKDENGIFENSVITISDKKSIFTINYNNENGLIEELILPTGKTVQFKDINEISKNL